MNARAAIKMNGLSRMERVSAAHMLRAMVSDWSALMRRFRDAASGDVASSEALPRRRRRDRHPDAPPRQPLFASRDLPPPDVARRGVASLPAGEAIAPPRAPEPMSEAQIAQLMATATARPIAVPVVPERLIRRCPTAATLEPRELRPARSLPCVADNLALLADRFESAAARHADAALIPPPEASISEAPLTAPAEMDAMAAEVALAKALATLRKLAEQKRPARLR